MQRHALLSSRSIAASIALLALVPVVSILCARTASGTATILPSCLPPSETHNSIAARVDDKGVLILRDGRQARPEALLLPPPDKDNARSSPRHEALVAMRSLVQGQRISLRLREPRYDRYRRLRAQIVVEDRVWLQREMLRRGFARVFITPDRHECSPALYAAEDEARGRRVGLWASDAFDVRTPGSLNWHDLGTFQIVQGEVANASVRGSRAYLNFGQDWRRDFTVTVAPADMKAFRSEGVDPQSYAGKTVRVRGWIDRLNGFEIEAAAPEQIEILSGQN